MQILAELKWLPIVISAVIGIALMLLLGFIIPLGTTLGGLLAITLGIGFLSYFASGLIAGAWAGWRGPSHGLFAGLLIWFANLIYGFITGVAYGPASQGLSFILGILLSGIFAIAIGALGGFVGERIRR